MQEYDDRELAACLREVAEMDAAIGASPAVKVRLLDELRAMRRARRVSLVKMYGLAATLALATTGVLWQLSTRSADEVSVRTELAPNDAEIATVFFPLTYSALPVTQGSIVRLEVPRAAFASLGVEPLDQAGSRPDVVLADVLVGEDGLARAVRFVRTVGFNTSQEQLP